MIRPRRAPAALALASALGLALAGCTHSSSGGGAGGPSGSPGTAGSSAASGTTRLVVKAARTAWQLPQPVSRLVVLPDGPGALLLMGGLTTGDRTTDGVFKLNPAGGALHQVGTLARPAHDAAGAVVHGRDVVFGGGSSSTIADVQAQPSGGGQASVVGRLPQARSDLSAATIGGTTYLVGGYDGSAEQPAVLATTDGTTFRTVATLHTTVRYAAVAAVGSDIWVFGGEHQQHTIDTIQRIDPKTGRVTVAGHLPTPLGEASAAVVGGHVLIAGGRTGGTVSGAVYLFDPAHARVRRVATLPTPVADAGVGVVGGTAYLVGGEAATQLSVVQKLTVRTVTTKPAPSQSASAQGSSSTQGSSALSDSHPFNGRLLIADRGNNRLLLVDASKHLLWHFPNANAPAPPTGFYFPDDAFFTHHGTAIISNQEGNDTIVQISFPGGKSMWSYGHPKVAKPLPGYLHEPDDAYLLRDGKVVVADANNCRVVVISPQGKQIGQIGQPGNCSHNPPTDLGYPNGDTPLADGNLLISEVHGSWISEYTLHGRLVWTTQLPITYPSDPQQIGPDKYLVADYARPGGLYEFDRAGHILWSYHPSSGPGMLDHPSLAEVLPGGFICVNDDYRNRVVIIDPHSKRIVWQYGHTDHRGRATGYLAIPDGFDLLEPDNSTPTHPYTG